MDTEERTYLEKLIKLKQRRLHLLQENRARSGSSAAPEVIMEIEDIEEELEGLNDRLNRVQAITVELYTYSDAPPRDAGTKQLAWASHFAPSLPSPETWDSILLPELQRLRQKIGRENRNATIALRPKAHLSAGFAFGYIFRSRASIRLWVEQQYEEDRIEWWRMSEKAPSIKGLLLEADISGGDGSDVDIIVELSISRDISAAVDRWQEDNSHAGCQRIRMVPDTGPDASAVADAAHALAMARQITKEIRATRDKHPSATIHLFGALPFALALMVGMRLNACEPVQCYEYKRPENVYLPSCRLVPGIAV